MKTKAITTIIVTSLLVSMVSTVFIASVTASPSNDLVGLWHFDDGLGTTAIDSVGTNHGTLYGGVAWITSGKFDNALDFDGVDSYVEVQDSSSLKPSAGITIEAWVYLDSYTIPKAKICTKWGTVASPFAVGYGYGLQILDDGRVETYLGPGAGVWKHHITTGTVSLDEWHHIVLTFDGSYVKIYIDNVEESWSDTFTLVHGDQELTIGIDNRNNANHPIDGIIDEVRIYSVALSADEIAEHAMGIYDFEWLPPITNADFALKDGTTLPIKFRIFDGSDNPCDGYTPGLTMIGPLGGPADTPTVGLWNFDEGTGDTAYDATINGNDGKLKPDYSTNSPTWTTGLIDGALEFDGVDDYVGVPDSSSLEPALVTIEAWIKREGAPGNNKYIVSKHYGPGWNSYALRAWNNGLQFYIGTISTWYGTPVAGSVWDGEWHHVAGTFDGSVLKLYIDGSEVSSMTVPIGTSIAYDGAGVNIGGPGDPWLGTHHFGGIIDEVRISNTARTFRSLTFDPRYDPDCYYIINFHPKEYGLDAGWYMATVDVGGNAIGSILFELSPGKGVGRGNSGKK